MLEKLAHTEEAAKRAVETKHATIDAAADYINRMNAVTSELGETGNGGPTLPGGSAEHSPSDEQKQDKE